MSVEYLIDTLIYINIFAILALSLNLEAGFTGLMNFGKVAFFAIGAYSSAILTTAGYGFITGLVVGMLLASIFAIIVAAPTVKLREDYLAIATIAFGEILRLFLLNEVELTNGPIGIRGIPQPFFEIFSENYQLFYLFLTLFFLALSFAIVSFIEKSQFGRILKSIREDETVALILGKNTFLFKIKIFLVASILASVAGSLFAHYITFVSPDMFMPTVTFAVWTMMIIGGYGNNVGVLIGVAIVQIIERATRFLKDVVELPVEDYNLRMIIIGLLLILFLLFKPQGLLKEKKFEVG